MLLSFFGWLVGGSLLRTIAAGALGVSVGFAGGYAKGRYDAWQSQAVEDLRTELAILKAEIAAKKEVDSLVDVLINDETNAAAANKDAEKDLDAAIETPVPAGICASRDFLSGLRNLK